MQLYGNLLYEVKVTFCVHCTIKSTIKSHVKICIYYPFLHNSRYTKLSMSIHVESEVVILKRMSYVFCWITLLSTFLLQFPTLFLRAHIHITNKKLIKSLLWKLYYKHKHEIPFNRKRMTCFNDTHTHSDIYKLHYL